MSKLLGFDLMPHLAAQVVRYGKILPSERFLWDNHQCTSKSLNSREHGPQVMAEAISPNQFLWVAGWLLGGGSEFPNSGCLRFLRSFFRIPRIEKLMVLEVR